MNRAALGPAFRARRRAVRTVAVAGAMALASCRHPSAPPAPAPEASPSPRVTANASGWVEKTLRRLTLEQKVGQMIGVRAPGLYQHPRSREWMHVLDEVRRLRVGCVVVFESEVASLPRMIDRMQAAAEVPLLVAADMERGIAMRIRRGVVPLPTAMAIGATRSEEDARFTGEVTAREGRALGIHWAFAPVADVNNNPQNPIINIRSYGEDPELVARLAAAFVRGARSGGLLTTVKHFPGHGDTGVDSHLQLPVVEADAARMERVELLPFRRTIAAGVDAVMVAHVAVPAMDASGTPATLSTPVVARLRDEMAFRGLVVTDAMDMQGVRGAWTGEGAVRAVRAGADFILLPPQTEVAIQAIVREVRASRIPEARIDASVRRILQAKEGAGLTARPPARAANMDDVNRPEDVSRALDVARRSITVVRNTGGVLPLHAEAPLRVLHVVLSSDLRNDMILGIPEEELSARKVPTQTVGLGPEVSEPTRERLVASSSQFTHVLASSFVRVTSSKGTADMAESHAQLLQALAATGRPVILVSYSSPYLLRQVPSVPVYVTAYGSAETSQRAAMGALFGEYAVSGKLPVTIPGLAAYGEGLEIPRHPMTLHTVSPEEVGFRADGLAEVDRVLEKAVADKAFPGAVVAVGRDGGLAHLRAFGRLTYDAGAPPTAVDTIYDLASLTKIVVTTTMAMILVDEGKLDLAKPVSAFVPEFGGGAKDRVTVGHLLTHSSGLDWWAKLYLELEGNDAYVRKVASLDLVYEPGAKSVYSDLGVILLGEVLERAAGKSLEVFARERILGPLGMSQTRYRPGRELLPRIAPTERDPWRGRVLQGEVHDENAFAMGGVAPHAGLFGTAGDLARFAQAMLNGGVLEHRRLAARETVERFTRRAGVPDSSRALGWDTPSENSSAGDLMSRRSFGHTGFTGTSMWIDPDRRLFVILLSNRVHPTRDNNAIRQVRRDVADAVVRALAQP